MLLAIDVGNTQTHLGMFRDDQLVEHWRFATVRFATADELASKLASLLDLRELRLRDVDAAIVSSVVPTWPTSPSSWSRAISTATGRWWGRR